MQASSSYLLQVLKCLIVKIKMVKVFTGIIVFFHMGFVNEIHAKLCKNLRILSSGHCHD